MATNKTQRLDKILAHIGIGTRKEIKQLIKKNHVTVNDKAVNDPGIHVNLEQDKIMVQGELIEYRDYIYVMLNKPQGYLSATEDRRAMVVLDLIPPELRAFDPFPVGRLDKDTEGLLLLTNDGKLAHQLLSPKKHVPKTYYAVIAGEVTAKDIDTFKQGVTLDDGYKTMPGELKILSSGSESEINLTIYEGKFHQVKRMFEAVEKQVTFLKRLSMGPLVLDESLQTGDYRELTQQELGELQVSCGYSSSK